MPFGFVAPDVNLQMERHDSSLLEPKPHDLCSTNNASAKLLCFRFFQAMMLVSAKLHSLYYLISHKVTAKVLSRAKVSTYYIYFFEFNIHMREVMKTCVN